MRTTQSKEKTELERKKTAKEQTGKKQMGEEQNVMEQLKKDTAYFHLPGLFEFYELAIHGRFWRSCRNMEFQRV